MKRIWEDTFSRTLLLTIYTILTVGAGQNFFVGGGVLVNVGHQQQSAFVCLFRAGFGMSSVGAGVFSHIAELENRAWGVAAVLGAGQVYANGAGVFDKIGGEVVNCAVSVFQALAGGSSYLGTGDMNIVGEQYARVTVTLDQNGVGLTFFNGAGQTSLIYVPSFVSAVVRSQKILGAEVRYDNFSSFGKLNTKIYVVLYSYIRSHLIRYS